MNDCPSSSESSGSPGAEESDDIWRRNEVSFRDSGFEYLSLEPNNEKVDTIETD